MFSFQLDKLLIFSFLIFCLPLKSIADESQVSLKYLKGAEALQITLLPNLEKRSNAQVSLEVVNLEDDNRKTIFAKKLADEAYTFQVSEEEITYPSYKARARVELISTEAEESLIFSDWIELGATWPAEAPVLGPVGATTSAKDGVDHWKGLVLVLLSASWMYVLWNWADLKLLSIQPVKKRYTANVESLPDDVLSKVEQVCQNAGSKEQRTGL